MSPRTILLLDLDCFYAQCECIRLGYDASETSLALLQWNSVLAVSYPARRQFDIKRGDGWDAVASKSQNQCLCVHVPVLTSEDLSTENNTPVAGLNSSSSVTELYRSIYCLSPEQQKEARRSSIGKRFHSTQGKASIENYRIASTRIFDVVNECIQEIHPSIVLERASIDEFFLDVTEASMTMCPTTHEIEQAVHATHVVGETQGHPVAWQTHLRVGCYVAYQIRKTVLEHLGFTLSAGISINKTIAKLSASYGKPNGQAVCYLDAIPFLLEDTPIRKCRNLGGKLGKRILELLPADTTPTVASIARHLTMAELKSQVGDSTGHWLFQLSSKGIDIEDVAAKNDSSITKSITAFKSLPYNGRGHLIEGIKEWLDLLANEVIARVDRDTIQNNRYPKICVLQYASEANEFHKHKSVRFPFPSRHQSPATRATTIIDATKRLLQEKEGKSYFIHRIGFCAVDFEQRDDYAQSIDRFFTTKVPHVASGATPVETCKNGSIAGKVTEQSNSQSKRKECGVLKSDMELARRLQSTYDKEHRALCILEQRKRKRTGKKVQTIDSFFQKR